MEKNGSSDIINGEFYNNIVAQRGGVVANKGTITEISGKFYDNQVDSTAYNNLGGSVVFNGDWTSSGVSARIDVIEGLFERNISKTTTGNVIYGTIFNDKEDSIGKIVGNFLNNTSESIGKGSSKGSAIANMGTIDEISGEVVDDIRVSGLFEENQVTYQSAGGSSEAVTGEGGAIYNHSNGTVGSLKNLEFKNNKVYGKINSSQGGAIMNYGRIDVIDNVVFEGNSVEVDEANGGGGALAVNGSSAKVTIISKSSFKGNSVIARDEDGNANAYGGALLIGDLSGSSTSAKGKVDKIVNTEFVDNVAQAQSSDAWVYGGAILSKDDLILEADAGTVLFRGNKTIAGGNEVSNGIYMLTGRNQKTLTLNAINGGKIVIDDGISGSKRSFPQYKDDYYRIVVSGDMDSEVQLNNFVENAVKITLDGTKLTLGTEESLKNGLVNELSDDISLSLNSGLLNLQNNVIQEVYVNIFDSTENAGLSIDADLESGNSDRIISSEVSPDSKITVDAVNIIKDGTQDITVFKTDSGSGSMFVGLDAFSAFTAQYKYTFSDKGNGVLAVESQNALKKGGLNGAVEDSGTGNKSYTLSETQENVVDHLGELQGGEGTHLTIEGNGLSLDGKGFSGMILGTGQGVKFNNIEKVFGFESGNGGVVNNNGGLLEIYDTSFVDNRADIGGAIYSSGNVSIVANNKDILFEGNYAVSSGKNNAVYMADENAELNLKANGKVIRFNDGIDGVAGYKINVSGLNDNESGVEFAGKVENLGELHIHSSSVRLADESVIENADVYLNGGMLDLNNGKIGELKLSDYTGNGGVLSIDIDPAAGQADVLHIGGNISGQTRLFVNALNDAKPQEDILFAKAFGNVANASFDVWRVSDSPYEWESVYKPEQKEWYLNTLAENPVLTPEMMGYFGLMSAGHEMNRNLLRDIQNKSAASRLKKGSCVISNGRSVYEGNYNMWVSPTYRSVKVEDQADYDADIFEMDAGVDFVANENHQGGIFLSYRDGDFDFSGKGDRFYASSSANADINSYNAGAYYQYTNKKWWAWAGVYGSYLDVKLDTDDAVKADTNGQGFGARVSFGYDWKVVKFWTISPIASVSYDWLHYGKFTDNAGKTVKYGDMSSLEAELGLRLQERCYRNGRFFNLYFQPGIVQTAYFNNDVRISGFSKVEMPENQTLGKMEAGFRLEVAEKWMAFIRSDYTFGGGYSNVSVFAGLNYAF